MQIYGLTAGMRERNREKAQSMEIPDKQNYYDAYLIRLWCVDDFSRPVWRMMLENVHSAERHNFNCLDDLFLFLGNQIQSQSTRGNPAD